MREVKLRQIGCARSVNSPNDRRLLSHGGWQDGSATSLSSRGVDGAGADAMALADKVSDAWIAIARW
jgi:hypothetical protein